MNKKVKSRFSIHMADLVCACISIIVGSLSSPMGFVLTLLYLTYSYMKGVRETFILIFFVLLCSTENGIYHTYLYALSFALYFVILQLIKILNRNLYQWLPYITALLSGLYALQYYGVEKTAIVLPVLSYIVMRILCDDYTWVHKAWFYPSFMKGALIYTIALLLVELMPNYKEAIMMVAMLAIAYTADVKITAILAISSYLLLVSKQTHILILVVLLSAYKNDKKNVLCLLVLALLFFPHTMEMYLYLALCLAGLLLVKGNLTQEIVMVSQKRMEARLSQSSLLKRQMQNYASIFQSLSEYYAQIHDVQAEILKNMANALQYNAEAIRKVDMLQKDTARIQRALEGYQYDVKNLVIEEPKEGCIQVCMDISNIKRGELRTTLLPLMEVLLHRNLEIEETKNRRFFYGYQHIQICDNIPFTIDAYADSIKNAYTSSGDTFSIFKFRQSVVCMISDGMGNGERAAQSSRLITNIFQRMMVSGITQDNAIKCINKLIQSDTYATLDVICFNRSKGVAYISKSAACPTFLLRDHEVYEINGNSLPVGIISQMQPDCFQVDLKANDEYLMVSDGIYMSEIHMWLKARTGRSVKEDIETFATLLKTTRRKDDSTLVLARVNDII